VTEQKLAEDFSICGQADNAILALNRSGIVLETLPVRQEHIFCMCWRLLTK
ncbi:hypothetical protein ACJX0J_028363, partial [Zea mays]